MNHFSYDEYINIINKIREYIPIVDYQDVIKNKLDKYCVIRHDVEYSLDRAYQLALVENKLGIESTYNIQIRNNNYNALSRKNIELAKEIWNMGHKLGVHIHMEGFKDDPTQDNYFHLTDYIRKDTETLSYYLDVPVDRFVFHRPKPAWLKIYVKVSGLLNLYDRPFFYYFEGKVPNDLDVYYFADSNHKWKWGSPLETSFDKIDKIQLLCHPYSWTDTGYDNVENFKTLIKEKDVEIKESMKSEMISFPKELL